MVVVTRLHAASAARVDTFVALAEEAAVVAVDGLVCQVRANAPIDTAVATARALSNDLPRSRSRGPCPRRFASGCLRRPAETALSASGGESTGDLPLGGYIAKFLSDLPRRKQQ